VRETRGGKPTAVDREEFPRENFNDGTRSWREQETERKRERRKKKKRNTLSGASSAARTPFIPHVDAREPEERRGARGDGKRAQALALEPPMGLRARARFPRARMLFRRAMCTADAISARREEGLSSIVTAVHSRWIPVTGRRRRNGRAIPRKDDRALLG